MTPELPDAEIKVLTKHYDQADRAMNDIRDTWDDKEAILTGTLKDQASDNTKSQVFDPRLSTIVLERAARVMGQLPTGKSLAVSKDDKGKNLLMNLVLDKYALPNANSQFDFLTKARLLDMYSLVYGVMFGMVDWVVTDEYVGPDMWLLPIRDVFIQPGAISLKEADWVQVVTMHSKGWLEGKKKDKTWKGIDEILEALDKDQGESKSDQDDKEQSEREKKFGTDVDSNSVKLITEYRKQGGSKGKGEWVTYAPKYDKIVRQIDNPHENGELPIIAKYAFPLLDSIYGLGEFERGITLQKAINSLINLYLDGVKMSIFPPVLINKDQVIPSTIKFGPAQKWLVNNPNAVTQLQLNPQGLSTFQSTYNFLNAALLNQAGTTDTTVQSGTDNTQGKTPQALKMIAARESARDNWDRFMMEKTIEEVLGKFVNLISKKQSKPITLRLFTAEIEEIAKMYPDVVEMFDSNERGEVTIDSGKFESVKFDYQIVPGSTVMADKEQEVKNLQQLFSMILQAPQVLDAMKQSKNPKTIDFGELITRIVSSSGIQDWDKVIIDYVQEEDPAYQQQMLQQMQQQQAQQIQQLQDPELQQAAQQILGNIGGIPAQPEGGMEYGI